MFFKLSISLGFFIFCFLSQRADGEMFLKFPFLSDFLFSVATIVAETLVRHPYEFLISAKQNFSTCRVMQLSHWIGPYIAHIFLNIFLHFLPEFHN